MRASYRIARPSDILADDDAFRLQKQWTSVFNADGVPLWRDLNQRHLAWCRDQIEIMVPLGGGIYHFAHHGQKLSALAGVSLKDKTTRDFKPEVTNFFSDIYTAALDHGSIIYACNESALATPVHSWKRYLFPLFEDDGTPACIIGLIKPSAQRHEVWDLASKAAGFGAGTLEPILDENDRVVDFLILEAAGLAPLLGAACPTSLKELLNGHLSETVITEILSAREGAMPFTDLLLVRDGEKTRQLKLDVLISWRGPILNATDVTQITQARRSLEDGAKELKLAQRMGRIATWHKSLDFKTTRWSPELYELMRLQQPAKGEAEKSIREYCPKEQGDQLLQSQQRVLQTGLTDVVDIEVHRGDGTTGYLSVTTSLLRDEAQQPVEFLGTVQDISERKESEIQLEQLAYFDPLTNLPNRAMFKKDLNHHLTAVLHESKVVYVLLMDLDNFKDVNDALGHAAGDDLLVQVARALRNAVPQRAQVARLGGDEFAIVYRPEFSSRSIEEIATEIVGLCAQPFQLDDGEVQIGISIGIAEATKDGMDAGTLLKNADLALYASKGAGRGRFSFYRENMGDMVEQRLKLGRDLKKALAENKLELHFQPQVELAANKVIGFEALLRWNHPEKGYIPPTEFIPIAESSSLICDLGFWVLAEACRTLKKWMDAGNAPVSVSVNVSTSQFWQSSFESEVAEILKNTGVDPRFITLEATESIFIEKSNHRIKRCFDTLAELGIGLSIDDFGTGYSSLGYLSEMHFGELKIDRSFIAGVHLNADKRKLLTGIIGLAHGLGLRTVGEGVETAEELLMLRHLGCNVVQGFYFDKAQPFENWHSMIAGIESKGELEQQSQPELFKFG